jgi:anti-sigma B factor antagonist
MFACSSIPPLIRVRREPGWTVLSLPGCDALNEYNSPLLAQRLDQLPELGTGECLLLDLSGIRYVSSTGLEVLVGLNRRIRAAGGRLLLANAGPAVREVLAVTRLDSVLEVLPDQSGASADRLSASPRQATARHVGRCGGLGVVS